MITEEWLKRTNPYPHVIAGSGIAHIADCPACLWRDDYTQFLFRILDAMELGEQ